MTMSSPPTGAVRLFRWQEPMQHPALYYSAWYYVPQVFSTPANWWIIWQWKVKPGLVYTATSDPYYIINLLNVSGHMELRLENWYTKARPAPLANATVPIGQWFQIETLYDAQGDGTGQVQVWLNNVLLWNLQNVPTKHAGTREVHWGIANYSDQVSPSPTTIYVDDVAIGLSRIGLTSAP